MNENVLQFYEAVSEDGELQEELAVVANGVDLDNLSEDEARKTMASAIAEFATAHDLDLTAADVLEAQETVPESELSEEELATISGGYDLCFIVGRKSDGSIKYTHFSTYLQRHGQSTEAGSGQ